MNYLDQLLTLHENQREPMARRYLLSAMGARPIGIATPDLVERLWKEITAPETSVRHEARRQLGRVLPRQLRRDYGLLAANGSVWTGYAAANLAVDGSAKWQPAWEARDAGAIAQAFGILLPAAERAIALMTGGTHRVRQLASVALGCLPLNPVVDRLVEGAHLEVPFQHAAALAELSVGPAREALTSAVRTTGLKRPDLITLLSRVPLAQALPLLQALENKTDAYGRASIAMGLEQVSPGLGRDLLTRLVAKREAWTSAHAFNAVQLGPLPGDLELVQMACAGQVHEFLQVVAVRSAGYVPGAPAAAFLKDKVRTGSERIRAVAVESLVRHRASPAELAPLASALLEGKSLRAKVIGLLALAPTDPERVAGGIEELMLATAPVERLEGAYMLGYMVGAEAGGILQEIAREDPDPDVRQQAIESLARQPDGVALERFGLLLDAEDPVLAKLASRAILELSPTAYQALKGDLEPLIRNTRSSVNRALMLRALGAVAARVRDGVPEILREHLASPDDTVARGALEGLKFFPGAASDGCIDRFLTHADPRLRASAAVSAFWAQRPGAGETMVGLLSSPDEAGVVPGLSALLECAAVMPGLVAQGRLQLTGAAKSGSTVATVEVDPAAAVVEGEPDQWVRTAAPKRLRHARDRIRDRYGKKPAVANDSKEILRTARHQFAELQSQLMNPVSEGQPIAKWLAIAALPLLIALGFWWRGRAPAQPPDTRPKRDYVVEHAQGAVEKVVGDAAPAAVARGDKLTPGTWLRTGPGGSTSAKHKQAAIIWLDANSRVKLGPPAQGAAATRDIWVSEPSGDVSIDLRGAHEALAWVPPFVVTAHDALFRVVKRANGPELVVESGSVSLEGPGAPGKPLTTGAKQRVEP